MNKETFGVFRVHSAPDPVIHDDIVKALNLNPNETTLELHLRDEWSGTRPQVLCRVVSNSFRRLAGYLLEQNLHPRYIYGVTYYPVAQASRLFGFTVERFMTDNRSFLSSLDSEIVGTTRYKRNRRGWSAQPYICYMDHDLFIARFSKEPKIHPTDLLTRLGLNS